MSIFSSTALSAASALPSVEHASRRTSSVLNSKGDGKQRDSLRRNSTSYRSSTATESRRTSYDSLASIKNRRRSLSHTRSVNCVNESNDNHQQQLQKHHHSDVGSAEDMVERFTNEDDDMTGGDSSSVEPSPPALQLYEHQLANCGDNAAKRGATHFTLGWLYFHGSAGVAVDHVRANSHFVAAADCGDALAAYYVGLILEEDGESLMALDAFVHAANEGCSAAMLSAGRIILAAHAQGVGKFTGFSKSDGVEWIRRGTSGDVSRKLF